MKKINKNDLKLDKEVISSLSGSELSKVNGGVNTTTTGTVIVTQSPECKSLKPYICAVATRNGGLTCNNCVASVDWCAETAGARSECFCMITDQCK